MILLAFAISHPRIALLTVADLADKIERERALTPPARLIHNSIILQHSILNGTVPLALEELVFTTIETVVRAVGTNHTSPRRARPMAMKKMSAVFEYIDAHLGDRVDLGNLSALVALSKYHFLRSFKRECGMTPYQYILGRRLRAAAVALLATEAPVARIAFDQGFADLSTFNHTFRRVMGVTPKAYRSNRNL